MSIFKNRTVIGVICILLALVIISVVGSGTHNIILALGILFIPSFAINAS